MAVAVAVLQVLLVGPIADAPRLPNDALLVAPVRLASHSAEVARKPAYLHAVDGICVANAARRNLPEMRRTHQRDCVKETITNAQATQCAQNIIKIVQKKDHRSIALEPLSKSKYALPN